MNDRSIKILNLLIQNPEYKLNDLEKNLGLTKRQINYSLELINNSLKEKKLPLIKRSKIGEFHIPLELLQSLTIRNDNIVDTSLLSDYERVEFLLLYLLIGDEYISLAHITDLLNISKNTVLLDIKNGNRYIEKYDLEILYTRKNGYELIGNEFNIRILLNDLVQKRRNFSQVFNPVEKLLIEKKDEIVHLVRTVEKNMNIRYADNSFDYIVDLISYTITRIKSNRVIDKTFFHNQVTGTIEFKTISDLLKDYLFLTKDDIEWITLLFLSSNTYENLKDDVNSDSLLKNHIDNMVLKFETQTLIEIDDKEIFKKRLFDHLRPAYFRIKYGLKLDDISTEEIMKGSDHSILINIIKDLISPLEIQLGKTFPNDELELLSFYFGYQLNMKNKYIAPKKKVVVVCSNGLIVSKMIMESLKKLFPEFHFLTSLSVREFQIFQSDYDLVFTTVSLKTNISQYIINPIMDYNEQINLRYRVLKDLGITEVDNLIGDLVNLVGRYAKINDSSMLKIGLKQFFMSTGENNETHILPPLEKYIESSYIKIVDKVIQWQDALNLACEPLIENKIIEERYITELIQQTQDPNNYSFLGTNIAIPHAEASKGILKDGIGLLISKTPIEYPNGNMINFIIPIAILDSTKHLRAMNQLASIGENKALNNSLKEASSINEAYKLIKELE